MKTQKIVLALALVAVTPAVLAAQDYVGGPGSKMSYIADNALARIKESNKNKEPQKQEPVQKKQNDTTNIYATVPAYYPYGGSEGHMLVREDLVQQQNNKPQRTQQQQQQQQQQQTNTPAETTNTPRRTTSTYNPYTGPDGHRYALGNAARDAQQDSTSVPAYVTESDSLARSNNVYVGNGQEEREARKEHRNFLQNLRHLGEEISHSIVQEAPYMK